MNKKKFTTFGFKKIKRNKKNNMVENVFNKIAKNYDLMNDIMSLGIHRIWKNKIIYYSKIKKNYKVLDVAGGTGDLTKKFSHMVGEKGLVVLLDINKKMIKIGRNKLRDQGIIKNIFYVQGDAEYLPFKNNYFDCVNISFGLRNITNKKKSLKSMFQVLKPGGNLIILDFSHPQCSFNFFKKLYDFYSFYIIPNIGKIITKSYNSYKYLIESIRTHPNQKKLKLAMIEIGFEKVIYYNFTGGIVSLHLGSKPMKLEL